MQIATTGLEIAKNVFQVHGVDASARVVVRKQPRRRQVLGFFKAQPPRLVGMEACATARYWARELMKRGHLMRRMPASQTGHCGHGWTCSLAAQSRLVPRQPQEGTVKKGFRRPRLNVIIPILTAAGSHPDCRAVLIQIVAR